MIRLTNLADYAVVVMTAAAKSPERRLSAPEVALVTGIPVPTVAKLMGTLARAGLLPGSHNHGDGWAQSALEMVALRVECRWKEDPAKAKPAW
jgi:DNA-binding IscR family transcriptional regulator